MSPSYLQQILVVLSILRHGLGGDVEVQTEVGALEVVEDLEGDVAVVHRADWAQRSFHKPAPRRSQAVNIEISVKGPDLRNDLVETYLLLNSLVCFLLPALRII